MNGTNIITSSQFNNIRDDAQKLVEPAGEFVVCYGGGVDSTAMLVLLKWAGMVPAMITFGDTGSEKPETYQQLDIMDEWLRSVGFPEITRCKKITLPTTQYDDFRGNCIDNETLPFLSWKQITCSQKWKQGPQDYAIRGCNAWHNKMEPKQIWRDYLAGAPRITKMIGYDATETSRSDKSDAIVAKDRKNGKLDFEMTYPLQEAGWTRAECIEAIEAEGLAVPVKSACYFCPSSQQWELFWLAGTHPHLFMNALQIERNALTGKHSRFSGDVDWITWEDMIQEYDDYPSLNTCVGLGIKFAWNHFARIEGLVDRQGRFIADRNDCLRKAAELQADGGNAADSRTCGGF